MLDYLPKDEDIVMTVGDQLRQEGRLEGVQQGIQQGIQREHQSKLAIARRLLQAGNSVKDVVKFTELTLQEVKELQNQTH